MRWNIKRSKLLFALIPIISIAFYIFTADHNLYADQSYVAFDIYKQISDTAVAEDGKSYSDYSAAENFAIAAGKYLATDSVQTTTNGTVTAMGFYKQTVINYKAKAHGHIFNESVSLSAIASVAEQRYFKDGAILYRSGKASGSAVKSWSDDVVEISPSVYRQRYGVVPQELTKYSVTSESILSGSFISDNADGTHTYELILEPEEAQKYARYEMMTYAGVTSFPEFLSCRLVYTIDSDWKILEITAYDSYKIALMGGVKCESKMTETFTYNDDFIPDRAQIFVDYVPKGDFGTISASKGPADYLSEAYGDYISGAKPLNLTADIDINGNKLGVTCALDLVGGEYRVSTDLGINAVYKGSTAYVDLFGEKYSLDTADLPDLGALLGGGLTGILGSGASIGSLKPDDMLAMLFENHSIEKSDYGVHVKMPFTLMGFDFDVDLGLRTVGEDLVTADTIDATITRDNLVIKVAARVTESAGLPAFAESEYTPLYFDVEKLIPFVNPIKNSVTSDTVHADISGAISKGGKSETFDAEVALKMNKAAESPYDAATLSANITLAGRRIDVNYKSGKIYMDAGNISVMLDAATIAEDKLGEIELPDSSLSLSDILGILEKIRTAVPGLNLQYATAILASVRVDGNTAVLPLPRLGENCEVSLTAGGDYLTSLEISGLEISGISADVSVHDMVYGGEFTDSEFYDDEYVDIGNLESFFPLIKQFTQANGFSVTLSGNLETPFISGDIKSAENENIIISRSPLEMSARLDFRGHDVSAVFKDGVIYLKLNNIMLRFTKGDIAAFKSELKSMGGDAQIISDVISVFEDTPQSLTESLMGGFTLGEILDIVTSLKSDGKDSLTAGVSYKGANASLTLTPSADGNGLNVKVHSLTYSEISTSLNLTVTPCEDAAVSAPDDAEDYVPLSALQSYLKPAVQTAYSDCYKLTFSGDVHDKANAETKIGGMLRIDRTAGLRVYLEITLSGKTGNQSAKLYLINENEGKIKPEDFTAYIDLNGFTASIGYESAVKTLAEVCEILDLHIGMIDELSASVGYESIGTNVFETFDLSALNGLRDTVNAIFNTTEDVSGAASGSSGILGLTGFISDDIVDKALVGITLGMHDGVLTVTIDNAIFAAENKDKQPALVKISHNGEYLSNVSISNIVANGDTVNFTADVACSDSFTDDDVITPPDTVKCDLCGMEQFLYAIINTADMREFEISGNLNADMNIIVAGLKLNIGVTARVKILDDGSTVAAIHLDIPRTTATVVFVPIEVLPKSLSNIYFVNNRLYFIVDQYESNGKIVNRKDIYQKTHFESATLAQFGANPYYYIFDVILRMNNTVKDMILKEVEKGGISVSGKDAITNINSIIKSCAVDESGKFTLVANLGKLLNNTSFSDVTVSIGTRDNYVTDLYIATKLAGIVTVTLDNAKVTNYVTDDSGKITGGNPVSAVPYGEDDKNLGDSLTHKIDNLEDDLALLFPIDAAETLAAKAQDKADKANAATIATYKADRKVTVCKRELDEAQAEYDEAKTRLEHATEGTLGYKRAVARFETAEIMLESAQENLAEAKHARLKAADYAEKTAATAELYAQKATAAAQRIAANTDERSTAAAQAALDAAQKATDAAQKATAKAAEVRAKAAEEEVQAE